MKNERFKASQVGKGNTSRSVLRFINAGTVAAVFGLPVVAAACAPQLPQNFTVIDGKLQNELHVVFDGNSELQQVCLDGPKMIFREGTYPLAPGRLHSLGMTEEEDDGSLNIRILDGDGIVELMNLAEREKLSPNWQNMAKDELITALQEITELHELWHACAKGTKNISKSDLENIHLDLASFLKNQGAMESIYDASLSERKLVDVKSIGFTYQATFISDKGIEDKHYFVMLEESVTEWIERYQIKKFANLNKVLGNMKPAYSRSHEAFLDYLAKDDDGFFKEVVMLKKRGDIIGFRNLLISKIMNKIRNAKLARDIANEFINAGSDPNLILNVYNGNMVYSIKGESDFKNWLLGHEFQVKEVNDYEMTISH